MNQSSPMSHDQVRLRGLHAHLSSCIRGQGHVIDRVTKALVRSELNLQKHSRFLFLGPTGVGKTELTSAFTTCLHDGKPGRLHRIDCSEFASADSVAGFLSAKRGAQGRLASLKLACGDTLLFDEIEKAGRSFQDLLLQLLEPGRITLTSGRVIDVSSNYIVCTSNIASHEILDLAHASFATIERHILRRAETVLRPEILNRFDDALVFRPLEYDTQVEILRQKLAAYLEPLRKERWHVEVDEGVIPFLVRYGFDRRMGARPLLRVIHRFVGNALASRALADSSRAGVLCVAGNGVELTLAGVSECSSTSKDCV